MGNNKEILKEIAKRLLEPDKEVVFLFGAGASISSGIPLSRTLKENLWARKLILRPWEDVKRLLEEVGVSAPLGNSAKNFDLGNATFEQLMAVASKLERGKPEERERKIARWLEIQIPDIYRSEKRYFPSFAYEFTCHLLSLELTRYVISMNYDELLDKAIDDELGKGRCRKVVSLEDFELLRNTDDWKEIADFFLIKPHGTRSMRRSCRYTTESVQEFEEDKQVVLEKVLMKSVLVLVGYSASDNDFLNLLSDLSLDNIKKIIVVNKNTDRALENLGGESDKVWRYEAGEEKFFRDLADALYEDESIRPWEYKDLYTKATRHFIRALVYKQVNPTNDRKEEKQEDSIRGNPLFFDRVDLLLEILIYCFKVRGLFTGRALATCPRIISALDNYLNVISALDRNLYTVEKNTNPIEYLLQKLIGSGLLEPGRVYLERNDVERVDPFDRWYYIPKKWGKNPGNLFEKAAGATAEFLAENLEGFFDEGIESNEFIKEITAWLADLPYDFDYDLLKGSSLYFCPLTKVERITQRKQFREKTEGILKAVEMPETKEEKLEYLYIISPSVAEWFSRWGDRFAGKREKIKIIINKDIYDIEESLHYENVYVMIEELTQNFPEAAMRAAPGVKYGVTLAFKESGKKIFGKAILFARDGKASSFTPIFIEEEKPIVKCKSDINKLKEFFDDMFESEGVVVIQ